MNMQLEHMEIQFINDFKSFKAKLIQKLKNFIDIEINIKSIYTKNQIINKKFTENNSLALIKWTDYIKQIKKLYGVTIHCKNIEVLRRLDTSLVTITQSVVESTLSEILSMIRIHEVSVSFKKNIRHIAIDVEFGKSQKMDTEILKLIINNKQNTNSGNTRRYTPQYKVKSNEIQILIPLKKL